MPVNALTKTLLLIALLSGALAGCIPTRHIEENQKLLHRNRIVVEKSHVRADQLRPYLRQSPNRRILGFYRFHLNIHQFASRGRENSIKRWMKNTIGEPPVLFDESQVHSSVRQLELFMHGKGYFHANVESSFHTRGKKAIVTYTVTGNQPFTIRDVEVKINDRHLADFVYSDTINSLIRRGQRYDVDNFQQERNRISRDLRNQGFFQFSREFIMFRVDSTIGQSQLDIELIINDPVAVRPRRSEDVLSPRHRRFVIDNVSVYPEHSPFRPNTSFNDTTTHLVERDSRLLSYTFFHDNPLRIRPRAIVNNIMIEPESFFRIGDVELTHDYLARLRNFRFINIQFVENKLKTQSEQIDTLGFLNARIELSRAPVNAITFEAEGMNTSGNLGIAGNMIYHNRNIFRGAEIFNLRLKGAMEAWDGTRQLEVTQSFPFNTLEMGVEASVNFPKLLLPFNMERLSRTARPKSILVTGINYRQRPDYTRYIYNLSYGFEWSPDTRKRQFLTPLEVSSIKVFNDSLLQAKIPDNNPLILSRYKDHLITGSKYSYLFNSQQVGRDVDFIYFRGNAELAGNMLYAISERIGAPQDSDQSYRLFGIPFAQFVKGDVDFRYYRVFDRNNTLVFRLMGGIGVPYGNTSVLPFIKSYYGGGANGIRAWKIYSLGPGGYQDTLDVRFDRYGDIKLEANIEYRFSIYKFWKAALFLDAGNVWFLNDNPQFPGGTFYLDSFYNDLAIGGGAGLRLDFDFFIVRVDAAFPIRNPAMPPGSRWASRIPGVGSWNFNLGIGYPF